jgi:hypothetical protein
VTIFNKRNALIGWLVVKLAKQRANATSTRTRIGAGAAAGFAALGGALFFWRKTRGTDE